MKDKVVVITGASRGLGKALAVAFSRRGAKVVVSARTQKEIEEIAKEINGLAISADVTKEKEIKKLLQETIAHFGRVDIWVNNAGIWQPPAKVEDLDIDRVRDLFEVNVLGTMYGSKAALIQMKKQNFGIIMNIISTSALSGRPSASGYAASKYAAKGFTDSLREEVKGGSIKVIGVYPGGMQTHLFDEQKPENFGDFLDAGVVSERLVTNLEKENPEELILKRPSK
ncbi:MAG: SDR family oxidoreductase [Candidatus Taylorbacteria bacterium]